jgi:hypothetical protein
MDFEQAVLEGIEARKRKDGAQWELGDLALALKPVYGGQTLEKYAERIGEEYSTLSDYRRVAEAYEIPARAGISWRHHREALTWPDRDYWLETARTSRPQWSVRKMVEMRAAEMGATELPTGAEIEAEVDEPEATAVEPDRLALLAEEDALDADLHAAAETTDEEVLAADVEEAAKAVRYAVNRFLTTFNRTFDPLQEVVKYVVSKPESLPERDRQAIRARLDRLKGTIDYVEQYI